MYKSEERPIVDQGQYMVISSLSLLFFNISGDQGTDQPTKWLIFISLIRHVKTDQAHTH